MRDKDFLATLSSRISARGMQVLRAIWDAQTSEENLPSFDEIYSVIVRESGEKLSKAWIYKCLAKLEEEGFIVVDSIRSPRRYMATKETLIAGLQRAQEERLLELEQKIEALNQQLHFLDEIDISEITGHVIEFMTRGLQIERSGVIEGVENIRKFIITHICEASRPGDVLKLTNRLDVLKGGPLSTGPVENKLLESVLKGLTLQALVIPTESNNQGSDLLARFLSSVSTLFIDAINSGRLQLKFLQHETETYRMMCLNQDMLILYLTDTYKADTAALVYRKDNSILVDDAIRTFDRLWNQATDVTEFFKQLVAARGMD